MTIIFKDLFYFYLCVYVSVPEGLETMSTTVHRDQKRAFNHPELEVQVFVSHRKWVLETKFRFSQEQNMLFGY